MFFFFNDTATTEIYTLSLHDALPIFIKENWIMSRKMHISFKENDNDLKLYLLAQSYKDKSAYVKTALEFYEKRSEEHTSELQSRQYLVCRLLLEKKK